MNGVLAIAGSVWLRIMKMKVVYFLICCAVAEIAITLLYETLMMSEHRMLMVDLSLLLTTLSGLLVVLTLAFDIPKELRDGGAATLLSKPIGRTSYLVGKFVGIALVGVLVAGLISAGFATVHYISFRAWSESALMGHLLAVLAVVPMAAISLFFAALTGEAAAAIFTTLAIWFAHSTAGLHGLALKLGGRSVELASLPGLYGGLLPDLNLFNLRAEATYGIEIGWSYVALAGTWGLLFSVALLAAAGILFNLRDLR
jgi:ABC-type transport system involved in multi-copper enzyme maturation permease subunit